MYGCALTVFLFNFYCVYMYLTWMNVFAPPVCSAPGSQVMVLDLLGLEWQLFVLYAVGAWNPTNKEEQLVLLTAEPPLQLRVTPVCLPCQNKKRKLHGSIMSWIFYILLKELYIYCHDQSKNLKYSKFIGRHFSCKFKEYPRIYHYRHYRLAHRNTKWKCGCTRSLFVNGSLAKQ